jgi:outer membrane immunogenic protein
MRLLGALFAAGLSLVSAVALAASAPALNWTGGYVGGTLGFGVGGGTNSSTVTGLGGGRFAFANAGFVDLDGILGGAAIGYNWQATPDWVGGIEADFQGSDIRGNPTTRNAYSGSGALLGAVATGTGTTAYSASIPWFGTLRGRIGFALDNLLIYGTGGLAYGQVRMSGALTDSGSRTIIAPPFTPVPFSTSSAFAGSSVNAGWTLGTGVEGALMQHWSWKAEYLYVDLGSLNLAAAGAGTMTGSVHTHFTDNIFRAGVNYRFGD